MKSLLFLLALTMYCTICRSQTANTPLDCPTLFAPNNSRVSIGADSLPLVTSLEACRQHCYADAKCLSFQMNNNIGEILCWAQYKSDAFRPDNLALQPNVFEYIKSVKCIATVFSIFPTGFEATSTTSTTSTTTTTTITSTTITTVTTITTTTPPPTTITTTPLATTVATTTHLATTVITTTTPVTTVITTTAAATSAAIYSTQQPAATTTTTTNTPISASIACVATYETNSTMSSVGATAYGSLTTEDSCKKQCSDLPLCVSYQINKNAGSALCWIQFKTNPFVVGNMWFTANLQEYIKQVKCQATNGCSIVFESNSTQVSTGATKFTQYTTAALCENACLQTSACLSYQLNTNNGEVLCWHQSKANAFEAGTLWSAPMVIEYIKTVKCADTSCYKWETLPNTNSRNGKQVNQPTVKTCQDYCISQPKCVGVDVDNLTNPPCWVHLDIEDFSFIFDKSVSVTQYRLTRDCKTSPTTHSTTTVAAATGDANEEDDDLTQETENKISVTAADATKAATTHTKVTTLNAVSMDTASAKKDAVTSATKGLSQMSVRPTPTRTWPSCRPSFAQNSTASSFDASPFPAATSAPECEMMCVATPNCVSYQIDKNPGSTLCWLQTNAAAFRQDNLYLQSGVTEYVKMADSPCVKTGCATIFAPNSTLVTSGATGSTSLQSAAACLGACAENIKCVSYQLNTNPGRILCWLQFKQDAFQSSNYYAESNVLEFVRQSTC